MAAPQTGQGARNLVQAFRLRMRTPNHGLHPTRLSPLEISGHTRFQLAL